MGGVCASHLPCISGPSGRRYYNLEIILHKNVQKDGPKGLQVCTSHRPFRSVRLTDLQAVILAVRSVRLTDLETFRPTANPLGGGAYSTSPPLGGGAYSTSPPLHFTSTWRWSLLLHLEVELTPLHLHLEVELTPLHPKRECCYRCKPEGLAF